MERAEKAQERLMWATRKDWVVMWATMLFTIFAVIGQLMRGREGLGFAIWYASMGGALAWLMFSTWREKRRNGS